MLSNLHKTPWPWFGGKSDAAPAVWQALGDVAHYVEPFAGSLAVLLRRPHTPNRSYFSETVNDMDGLLVNAWRAMRSSPDAMADAASWPVSEADLHARHLAIVRWRESQGRERLMADPDFYDVKMAGWWAWGQSCWIGSGWCSGKGPWSEVDGVLVKQARGVSTREPGVDRQRPDLGNDGKGVNRPQAREPGVDRKRPHLGNNGQGVNHAGTREPGVGDYHEMTMPELLRWFQFLSARLRHVRIVNGDWARVCTDGALKTIPVRGGKGFAGVFLDPPYTAETGRDSTLYTEEDLSIAHACREWAREAGKDPSIRIVLAGFDGEHNSLEQEGWRSVDWYRAGYLRGGMANTGRDGNVKQSQKLERLWLSPHSVPAAESDDADGQVDMFAGW